MQEIAQKGYVNELDLIHMIIAGLRDISTAVSILHSANTLTELKSAVARYERVLQELKATSFAPQPWFERGFPKNKGTTRPSAQNEMGHISFEHRRPKREFNACFRCFQTGHSYRECPEGPSRASKPEAAVEEGSSHASEDLEP